MHLDSAAADELAGAAGSPLWQRLPAAAPPAAATAAQPRRPRGCGGGFAISSCFGYGRGVAGADGGSALQLAAGGGGADGAGAAATSSLVRLVSGSVSGSSPRSGAAWPDCRVCLGEVSGADLESGLAVNLGCSCSGELSRLHVECARSWFRRRGSTICEVCGAEAVGLPKDLREELQGLRRQLEAAPAALVLPSMQAAPIWLAACGPFVLEYLLVCLMPALLMGLLLSSFYMHRLRIGAVWSNLLSWLVASASTLNWLISASWRQHYAFSAIYLAVITLATLLVQEVDRIASGVASRDDASWLAAATHTPVRHQPWVWPLAQLVPVAAAPAPADGAALAVLGQLSSRVRAGGVDLPADAKPSSAAWPEPLASAELQCAVLGLLLGSFLSSLLVLRLWGRHRCCRPPPSRFAVLWHLF